MNKFSSFIASNGSILAVSGAVVLVLAGAGFFFKDTLLGVERSETQSPANVVAQDVEAADEAKPDVLSEVEKTLAPKFDIARIEPDGQALIAGTARAGETVEVLLDGVVIATAEAGSTGEFAAFAELPSSDAPRVLSLRGQSSELQSLNTVVIAPIANVSEFAMDADNANETVSTETETSPQVQAVLLASEDGVQVVQPAAPVVMSQVALDAISYSQAGEVQLSGRAPNDGFVRVYLDNKPITTQRIEENGNWRTELPNVDSGVYTLRVDEVDAQGQVQSRVETPFKRELPEKLAAGTDVKLVTVQPGATLWALARERYGKGELYVQLYNANKDQIRDPDLIYPGQVFDIPD